MDASYFFTQFAAYNTDWLPVNVILWLLLLITTALVFMRSADMRSQALIKGALALVFLWNGIVFFFFYMTLSAVPGGIPMVVIGLLFATDIFRKRITISLPASGWVRYATLAWAIWALGLYTIAGWLTGHPYPGGPLPAAPCPTTILAIALLSTSMATLKTTRLLFTLLFALLLWWAFFAGTFAPAMYGFYLDLTLLAAGVYGLVMILKNRPNAGVMG
ncbi:MAG: hypothetical protein A4E36_01558 [Methanoregulaceae archaeon PtaB.Bin009]|jgi:hypothetical protein|nr:MAG: hypothetical protein A4E36_01558 [Methanoregulaceae archaeon PtaB.Bin009]HNS82271.1 DUF6064 family protein [Methanolinea sp.]